MRRRGCALRPGTACSCRGTPRTENNDPDAEAVVVIARGTQEAIVVNLPSVRGD